MFPVPFRRFNRLEYRRNNLLLCHRRSRLLYHFLRRQGNRLATPHDSLLLSLLQILLFGPRRSLQDSRPCNRLWLPRNSPLCNHRALQRCNQLLGRPLNRRLSPRAFPRSSPTPCPLAFHRHSPRLFLVVPLPISRLEFPRASPLQNQVSSLLVGPQ